MAKAVQLIDKNNNKCYAAPYWPISSIYISVVNTNPSKWFGGTWVAFGTGRCLVGVDTSQSEFNKVMKTGGSKYLQEHSHAYTTPIYAGQNLWGLPSYQYTWDTYQVKTQQTNVAGSGDSGNLQPYITVYMWRRTA